MISHLSSFIQHQADVIATHFQQSTINTQPLSGIFLLSVSDGFRRAKTVQIQFDGDLQKNSDFYPLVEQQIEQLQAKFFNPLKWAKLEWVKSSTPKTLVELRKELKNYKRNYFRSGIAFLHADEWLLLPESELNANACLYGGADEPLAQWNANNIRVYLTQRFGEDLSESLNQSSQLYTFITAGLFFDVETQEVHLLSTAPRTHGRRALPPLSAEPLAELIGKITAYLGSQVLENGKYEYGHFPCFGRPIDTYNTLRHASSTYALLEGYEFCREQNFSDDALVSLIQQAESALDYLEHQIIRHYSNDVAYAVEINNEIKLGANAVAILALSKYVMIFPDSERVAGYLALCEKLANGIVKMQQPNGSFVHVLDGKTLKVLAENRVIYYDGEAAFGLMRLYGITKDARWIECVRRAFDYFVQAGHNGAHDHWLSYCSNELAIYQPERKYFEFAVNNVKGYVNFIHKRITTFPTLLELSMAFHKMLLKLDEFPQFADVLDGFDVAEFYQALHTRANYLMNGVFFPEVAMNFRYPNTVLYGCFIRHHSFRVRIDDVEHYLSGLIAYHQFLKEQKYPISLTSKTNTDTVPQVWTADVIAEKLNGKWAKAPANKDWRATGLCIYYTTFEKGHLIVPRPKGQLKGGLIDEHIEKFVKEGASAIICEDAAQHLHLDVPILVVESQDKAIVELGYLARERYQGKVVAVTGSLGKTTSVSLINNVLSEFLVSVQTKENANILRGIAWNLASMPKDADVWVVETAIGKMRHNSALVRPNIAVVTNISEGHLIQAPTLEEVARQKSQLFDNMPADGVVIVNQDVSTFDILAERAKQNGLQLVTFGESQAADIRLISFENNIAVIDVFGEQYRFESTLPRYLVVNTLCAVAVARELGLPITKCLQKISEFQPLEGRGRVLKTQFNGKNLTVIDGAYSATPLSMKSSLEHLAQLSPNLGSRVAILGDMTFLGDKEVDYHLAIAEMLKQTDVDRIILCGELMRYLWEKIKDQYPNRIGWYQDGKVLLPMLDKWLGDGDTVLVKGEFVAKLEFVVKQLIKDMNAHPMQKNYLPLTAAGLVTATGGKWIVTPPSNYAATGMSIFPKRFEAGHIIVARGKTMTTGYFSPVAVKALVQQGASAIITDDEEAYQDFGVPVLLVKEIEAATIDVGAYVRRWYSGNVIGVTGSAGKTTTVWMLAHTLSAFGDVGQTLDSANVPPGIAWNLSMMAQGAPHWVLEMAIGRMDVNSRMVQPDLAIITNIAPAHLEYHKTVEMIAVKKARIFEGMKPQSHAIVCRDIEQFDILAAKAAECHLRLTTYGEHPEADIRLLSINSGVAEISLFGKPYSFKMQTKGKHIVLNALAVLAVIYHRGLDIEKAIKQLVGFKAVEGRGEVSKLEYQGKAITVIDEAYNANPISMKAALETFNEMRAAKKHKLAIIGDMLELGPDSQTYHLDMLSYLANLKVREFVFVGEMCRAVSDKMAELGVRTTHFENVVQLSKQIAGIVQDGDMVLIKASNGIGLQGVFNEPKLSAEQPISAKAAIAAEKMSREVRLLRSFNADEKLLPASLTKVLSLMVVWDKIVKESIDIHTHKVRMPVELLRGSSEHYQFFHLDEKIEMVKLLQSSLVVSSNEAIYALALWHSGDEQTFVQAMNQKAAAIGMKDSLFTSASGLVRKGHTTAQDMLTMAVCFINDYPELTAFGCLKSFTHNGKKLPNTNRLLHSRPEVRGLKTGNLVGIGANLINYFVKDDKHYVSVVLLAPSRAECFDISEALMKYCLASD